MIDHERLASIAQGSQRTSAEIVADFRRANVLDTRRIHLAFAAGKLEEMGLVAHRVKGACLMLGASGLGEACSLLALSGRVHNEENAREALALYDRESAALEAFLEASAQDKIAVPPAAQQGAGICTGLRFVVAEDHDFQRDLIMMLLRRMGAAGVLGVSDGAQALEQVRAREIEIDILVLDLSMPGIDGREVLQKLAEWRSQVAVILNSAISPSAIGEVMQHARACDIRVLGVVSKPLTEAALTPLVKAYRALAAV